MSSGPVNIKNIPERIRFNLYHLMYKLYRNYQFLTNSYGPDWLLLKMAGWGWVKNQQTNQGEDCIFLVQYT